MKKSRIKAEITLPFFATLVILVFSVVFFVVLYPLIIVKYSSNIRLTVTGLLVVISIASAMAGIIFYLTIKKRS